MCDADGTFGNVEGSVASILGVTNDQESNIDAFVKSFFDEIDGKANHCIVLVLARAVVHYQIELFVRSGFIKVVVVV